MRIFIDLNAELCSPAGRLLCLCAVANRLDGSGERERQSCKTQNNEPKEATMLCPVKKNFRVG